MLLFCVTVGALNLTHFLIFYYIFSIRKILLLAEQILLIVLMCQHCFSDYCFYINIKYMNII